MTFPAAVAPALTGPSLGADPAPLDVIKVLGSKLSGQAPVLDRIDSYYRGQQPINFIHPDVRARLGNRLTTLVMNFPRLVVDTLNDRLQVTGFRLAEDNDDGDRDLWKIWQANNLDVSSVRLHAQTLRYGRSFMSVWSRPGGGAPLIAVESPRQVAVDWDPATFEVRSALKRWQDGRTRYATVFLPDRVERFVYGDRGWQVRTDSPGIVDNPLGVVPIVPYLNRWDLDALDGESELTDILPIADAINKLATDMMVTSEFHAGPRRYAEGVEIEEGPNGERLKDRIKEYWDAATQGETWLAGTGVRFGQFSVAELNNFVTGIKALTVILASLAALPGHYVGIATDNPASADAIRASEALLDKRGDRCTLTLGESHETTIRLAVRVRDGVGADPMPDLETLWAATSTPTPAQLADATVKKVQAEIIDIPQAQEDLGYSPQERQRMAERRAAAVAEQADAATSARVAQALALIDEQGVPAAAAFAAVGLLTPARGMPKPGPVSPATPQGDPVAAETVPTP